MGARKPDIILNGIPYLLFEAPDVDAYREYAEPRHVQEGDVAGASRSSKSARQDILTWRWDDWRKGEGQYAITEDDEDSFKKYFYSKGAVDISTPGEVSLGLAITQSYASGATTYHQGPYMVLTRHDSTLNPKNVGFLVNQKVFMHDDTASFTTDTWNDMGNAAADAGNRVAGPARYLGGFIYAAYKDGSGAASSSRIRRITAADPDVANITTAPNVAETLGTATTTNAENPLPADNRLYVFKDATGKLDVFSKPLDEAIGTAFKTADSAKGAGSEAGVAALGKRIHIVTQYAEEEPRIRLYDGQAGYEREIMPEGFRMATEPLDSVQFLGDILYLGGYETGEDGDYVAAVGWVAPGRTGTWRVRDFTEIKDAGYRPAKFGIALPGVGNQILFVPNEYTDSGFERGIFLYNAAEGSISQYIDIDSTLTNPARIISVRRIGGLYWFGVHMAQFQGTAAEVRVYRTHYAPNARTGEVGTGHHPASSEIISSYYDFKYREETKVLRTLKIEVAPLPSNTKIEIILEDELGNTITTDIFGAALEITDTDSTTKEFRLSGLDADSDAVTRTAKALRIHAILKNLNGHTESTPILRCVAIDADITDYAYFYDVVLALQDQHSAMRLLDRQVTGEQQMENIREITRRENGIKQVIPFDPKCVSGGQGGQLPEGSVNAARYPVAVEVKDFDLRNLNKANGFVKLRLQEV